MCLGFMFGKCVDGCVVLFLGVVFIVLAVEAGSQSHGRRLGVGQSPIPVET